MDAEQPAPRGELEGRELLDRFCLHVQLYPCLCKYTERRSDDDDRDERRGDRRRRSCDDHEVRGNPPRHVHHGGRARERRLLHARPRAPAREEDREPGRPDRLPPLLRGRGRLGRGGHHVLRVSRRPPRARGGRDGAHGLVPHRLERGARLLGVASRRRGSRHEPRREPAPIRGSRGPRPRARRLPGHRRASRRAPSGDPRRARPPGVRRRARLRLPPRGEPRAARARDGLRLHRPERLGGARGEARRSLRL